MTSTAPTHTGKPRCPPARPSSKAARSAAPLFSPSPAPAALSTGSTVLKGCPIGGPDVCAFSSPGEWIDVPAGTTAIYIDVYCTANGCPLATGDAAHNYLSAFARLASATVRLEDDSPPTINAIGGTLWTDGWKNGAQTLSIDASDNSGIREVSLLVDGQIAGKTERGCNAANTVPCPSGSDTFPVGTGTMSDGV